MNQNWIAIHGPLVKHSAKKAKDRAIAGVRSIRHYFGHRYKSLSDVQVQTTARGYLSKVMSGRVGRVVFA